MAHGYGLGGSGSNLWTREVARALCRDGHTVHLLCQESRPDALDFVAEAWTYDADARPSRLFARDVPHPGRCVIHRPELEVLPTFVRPGKPSEYVFAILDLDARRIEEYLRRNAAVVSRIVADHGVPAFHVNHVLLLSESLRRVKEATGTPWAVMPHGSALEYVVKKDRGMRQMARRALEDADRLLVLNEDVRRRLEEVFPDLTRLDERARTVRAGVDTDLFRVVPRNERAGAFDRVAEALDGVEGGRTPAQTEAFLRALDGLASPSAAGGPDLAGDEPAFEDALRRAVDAAADHPSGRPDVDAAARLASVAWGEVPVLLHVGRFIGGKGAPSVITALPDLLGEHPRTRLVMVGAGPLREIMEALVHAMGSGRRELVRWIFEHGDGFDPDGYGAFEGSRRHLRALADDSDLDGWFERARAVDLERVVFTGYLEHDVLCRLFPLADVAVFPSLVAEASPLVVAEAAASGCLPMGTDFAGMRRTLEAVGEGLDEGLRRAMKVRSDPEHVVGDIARAGAEALDVLTRPEGDAAEALRRVAVERFDWRRIAETLVAALDEMEPVRPPRG